MLMYYMDPNKYLSIFDFDTFFIAFVKISA